MGKYLIIGIVVIALVAGGLYLTKKPVTAPEESAVPAQGTTGAAPLVTEPATGNIDDIANDILSDNQNDLPPATETDPSILDENSTALDGFGQSLDGSQL